MRRTNHPLLERARSSLDRRLIAHHAHAHDVQNLGGSSLNSCASAPSKQDPRPSSSSAHVTRLPPIARFALLASVIVACGRARHVDPSIASQKPVEPPPVAMAPLTPVPCEADAWSQGLMPKQGESPARCAWQPVEPSCSHCAARRFAHLDCGFRGRNPIPHPSGSDFALEVISGVGDFRLDPQGHVLRLPYHRSVLFTANGVVTLVSKTGFGGGEGVMSWSEPSRCELLPLRGDIEAPFVAYDQSIRGWLDGRMVLRTNDGKWQLATEDASPTTLSASAPHAMASGLDARVWYVSGPVKNTYRILAQRWGFPPVVIFETQEHMQPAR